MTYRSYRAYFLVFFLTLGLHSVSFAFDNARSIPFQKVSGLMLVEASLNGSSGTFIFDTGANGVLINSNTELNGLSYHNTITGTAISEEITLNSFEFGGIVLEDYTAYSLDLSQLEIHLGRKLTGIIGGNLLENDLMLINTVTSKIEIISRKALKELKAAFKNKYSIQFENDVPIVQLSVDGEELNLVLDSGASVSLFDNSVLDLIPENISVTDKSFDLLTASQEKTESFYYSLNNMEILNNKEVGVVDLSEINSLFEKQIHGIISFDGLSATNIMIDFKRSELYLQ